MRWGGEETRGCREKILNKRIDPFGRAYKGLYQRKDRETKKEPNVGMGINTQIQESLRARPKVDGKGGPC